MVIVDDHIALLAITGRLPDLRATGPVVTTYGFHYRLVRAVADTTRTGSLSKRIDDPTAALRRVRQPPANRLLVLDPRVSIAEAATAAATHRTNPLLGELLGAARHHDAAVRVTGANAGRRWPQVFAAEEIDFDVVAMS